MKVGDYVRTKYGISKIVAFYSNAIFNDKNKRIENNLIIKSSPNIADLIEEGDYINGIRVEEITKYTIWLQDMRDIEKSHAIKEIETIVTREQFESMEYKVGE